jgi:ABC-type proline/glycine betaine transport system permease subunit
VIQNDTVLEIFETYTIPLGDWVEVIVQFIVDNFRPVFQAIRAPVNVVLTGIEAFFQWLPPLVLILAIGLIAWQVASRGIAIYSIFALFFVGFLGAWSQAMTTLALVLTAVFFCILIGIPLGILSAWNQRFEQIMRPVLDAMQTLPAFVYLVPVVMLFGIGEVPGVIVTFIFAVPPLIRLTNIGIQQVSEEVVEAAIAFGSTPRQILWEAQIPLAMPTILAGVNQAIMLALSMVVIASMISVEGLGQMVLRGIGRLDVGLATVGGISIVLIAVMLDRLTQAIGKPHRLPWRKRGPVGLVLSLIQGKTRPQNAAS